MNDPACPWCEGEECVCVCTEEKPKEKENWCGFFCHCGCGQKCACGLPRFNYPDTRNTADLEAWARVYRQEHELLRGRPMAATHPAPPRGADGATSYNIVTCQRSGCVLALGHHGRCLRGDKP